MKKKFTLHYWLRKLMISKAVQFFFPKKILRKVVFDSTYHSAHWKHGEKNQKEEYISLSGPGSNLDIDGLNINIKNLDKIIKKYKITSMLDVPCGDFLWMEKLLKKNEEIKYLGIDIVDDLIKKNNEKYSSKNINFTCKDIFEKKNFDDLNFDLLLCKDFFIHNSNEDILNFLKKIKNSKFTYFICDSHIYEKENRDIQIGKHRKLNIQSKPFNLKNPIESYEEYQDRHVFLFEVKRM